MAPGTGKEVLMAAKTAKKEVERDLAEAYNEFKEFEGRRYTGMKVGRGHKWHYEAGSRACAGDEFRGGVIHKLSLG